MASSTTKIVESPEIVSSNIVKEGWLYKQIYGKKWNCIYFLLNDKGKLLGFKNKPGKRSRGDIICDINIIGCQSVEVHRPKNYRFNIKTKHSNIATQHMFSARLENDRKDWILAIQNASENVSECEERKVTADDFIALKVLGRGGYAKVNLCREKATGQLVAMKILNKQTILDRKEVHHAFSENEILKGINHPFLTHLKYSFQTHERIFFIMEYAAGGELFAHLEREHRFSESKARFYGAEIILALAYLHSKGILYRDIKLENILLARDGHIKICDFGLSKVDISYNTKAKTFCGTPEYMAPEIILREPYGRAVDWWSTGIVIYEMIDGLPPFISSESELIPELILTANLKFSQYFSTDARRLLTRLLIKKPELRLGADSDDAEAIKAHPFFASINWDALEQKRIHPPTMPLITHDLDTTNFDKQFVNDSTMFTPTDDQMLDLPDTVTYFAGFNFQDSL